MRAKEQTKTEIIMSRLTKLALPALLLTTAICTQCANYRYKEPVPAVNDASVTKRDTAKATRAKFTSAPMQTLQNATE